MLAPYLKTLVKTGRLTVQVPGQAPMVFGEDNPPPGLDVEMTLKSPATVLWLGLNPELHFGEAYMNGDLTVTRGDLWALMELIGRNLPNRGPMKPLNAWLKRRREALATRNTAKTARSHVAHHYDLSETLYRSFLDADMQYSCAYFSDPGMTLEEAQLAKKLHLISKLDLRSGQTVLDIGCGWGGLALEIARRADVKVTGITLSQEQLAVARMRARAEGLSDRVKFELIDYREMAESENQARFDRVISVGMFEHVGPPQYVTYFSTIKKLPWSIRSATRAQVAAPTNGSTNISSPAAIFRPCRRSPARSRSRNCGSPISRSCASTMPKPCATGGIASPRRAREWPSYTTSVSAGCGSSTWRFARWVSALPPWSSSRSS
jgi:cyclopropane-fatty-acyl-phospholipid synthase